MGTVLGPEHFTVSPTANERYWRSAGVDHPALRDGALYPLMAANLTILTFHTAVREPVLHTHQRLVCHRRADAPADLTVEATITDRYEKRGREYAVVQAEISLGGSPVWTSVATFCEP